MENGWSRDWAYRMNDRSRMTQGRGAVPMISRIAVLGVLLVTAGGCRRAVLEPVPGPVRNSMLAVAANPEKYAGQHVTLLGYLSLNQENYALFLHEEDFKRMLNSNAIWLNMSPEEKTAFSQFNGRYCLVEGVFKFGDYGFGGFYAGAVDVTRIGDYVDAASMGAVEVRAPEKSTEGEPK